MKIASLLRDLDYLNLIKSEIKEIIEQNQNLDPMLLSDFLKCHIRGTAIAFSSMKSKKKRKREKELLEEILNLKKSLAVFPKSDTQNLLDNKKVESEKINESPNAGLILRSKARWVECGEKSTKYFLNLEKRN